MSKSVLFEDDSDDAEGDHFRVRPQYQGKKGERLLALQARFASDDRFKIDSRFEESGDEGEESFARDEEKGDKGASSLTVDEERRRNLAILESVVGKSKGGSKSVYFTDISKKRYDPERADQHTDKRKRGKKQESDATSPETRVTQKEASSKDDVAPVIEEEGRSFFLKREAFSKSASAGEKFAFGFGSSAETKRGGGGSEGGGGGALGEKRDTRSKKVLGFLDKNPFKYDSSSSDEEEEEGCVHKGGEGFAAAAKELDFGRRLAAKSAAAAPSGAPTREGFFFSADDVRFREIEEFMARKESLDEIRERYEKEERPVLAAIIKKKIRSRAKKQRLSFSAKQTNVERKRRFGKKRKFSKRK